MCSFPWKRESNGSHCRYLTNHRISRIRHEMALQRVQQMVLIPNSR